MRRLGSLAVPVVLVLATAVLTPATHADKGPTVTMLGEIPFAEDSGASSAVMDECTLQTRLPGFIKAAAKKTNVVLVGEITDASEGQVLTLEITHVVGFSGGAWSGPKSVTVEGTLTENGEVIGTFTASRYSTGGMYGGFKGTCSILGRCIQTLGSDIAKFLEKPKMDARLGDA